MVNENAEGPILLGPTSSKILKAIIAGSADDNTTTSAEIASKAGTSANQTRTILREFRSLEYVEAFSSGSISDNTIRYRIAEGVEERFAAGAKIKGSRKRPAAKPMLTAEYRATVIEIAAYDRAIIRWTGTAQREKAALIEAGEDPKDIEKWTTHPVEIDGKAFDLPACEITKKLRKFRRKLVTPAFRAAQKKDDEDFPVVAVEAK